MTGTPTTNITAAHKSHFQAMTSGEYDNFALFSCFVNGEPASAICAIVPDDEAEGGVIIQPLFVSVTDSMILTDHDGVPANANHPASPDQGD